MVSRLDVLIHAATPPECSRIRGRLEATKETVVARRRLYEGRLAGYRVGVLAGGIGKANTAMVLGAALERVSAGLLLVTGVAGAYPSSGLSPGDLAVATLEAYGDEGVETSDGFRGLEEVGFPAWENERARYFNHFDVDLTALEGLSSAAARVGRFVAGPFVTVSTVTGSTRRARELEERYGGVCENMEGAAAAHVAAVYETPFAEVRGISNRVGPRNRRSWKTDAAAAAAQEAVMRFLEFWAP